MSADAFCRAPTMCEPAADSPLLQAAATQSASVHLRATPAGATPDSWPSSRRLQTFPRRAVFIGVLAAMLGIAGLISPRAAAGQWPWALPLAPRQTPHPAVVRVNVEEADGMAHGSGTLVDVREQYGLVVTNWHVVRDASGTISVVFPDGFRSTARVLRADRDWDLAALLIWRPKVTPVSIAVHAPRPGEMLTIAGYGSGDYRAQSGVCTQYVAPSQQHPFEMVEVAASARQGDSGGPILNASGELAGVLFGSGGGTTSGSYGGRVQQFMQGIWPPGLNNTNTTAVATNDARRVPGRAATARPRTPSMDQPQSAPLQSLPPQSLAALDNPAPGRQATTRSLSTLPNSPQDSAARSPSPPSPVTSAGESTAFTSSPMSPDDSTRGPATHFDWQAFVGRSLPEQGKTFFAILGLFALVAQFSRILTRPSE